MTYLPLLLVLCETFALNDAKRVRILLASASYGPCIPKMADRSHGALGPHSLPRRASNQSTSSPAIGDDLCRLSKAWKHLQVHNSLSSQKGKAPSTHVHNRNMQDSRLLAATVAPIGGSTPSTFPCVHLPNNTTVNLCRQTGWSSTSWNMKPRSSVQLGYLARLHKQITMACTWCYWEVLARAGIGSGPEFSTFLLCLP